MTKRLLLSLCALLAAGAAHAGGQVTFYGWTNFGGQDVTVTDESREFSISGSAPESALVRSGRWEICSRPDYRGRCTLLEPGEYPKLGEQFGYVASAREIGTITERETTYRRYTVERERRGWR